MKKYLCVVLALLMLFVLTACSKNVSVGSVLSDGADVADTDATGEKEQSEQGDSKVTQKKTSASDQVTDETDETQTAEDGGVTTTQYTKKTRGTTTKKTRATTSAGNTTPTNAGSTNTNIPTELKDAGLLLLHGRVKEQGDGLSLPYSDCGITITGELEGDVLLGLNLGSNGCVINIVVDGDVDHVKTMRLSDGYRLVTVCSGLKKGNHTIEITRGTASNYGSAVIDGIYYDGTLKTPTKKELQIEFIGDSVTCSEGSIKSGGYSVDGHNSFYGYAALTARALDAGLATEAVCGSKTAGMRTRFNDGSWNFAANPKDIVVVNLGTNDVGWPGSSVPATFKSDVKGLIGDIRARYGKDTYIVWAYGMMFDTNKSAVKSAVEEYATDNDDARVLFCDMSSVKDTSGYGSHPSAEGHEAAANLLTQYIQQNCNI